MEQPKKKKAGAQAPRSGAEAAALSTVKDPKAARMLRMGEALGNDELQRRIERGNASRDELLLYMSSRLNAMRQAQLAEQHYGKEDMRESYKAIADEQKQNITKPEPMRWIESARLYEEAAYQMCRGALGRGTDLMQRAMEAERKAFEAVGDQIGVKDLGPDKDGPAAMGDVQPNQACGPRDIPGEIDKRADELQRNTTEFKDPPGRTRVADPWWTLEDEEEEEEGQPGHGG